MEINEDDDDFIDCPDCGGDGKTVQYLNFQIDAGSKWARTIHDSWTEDCDMCGGTGKFFANTQCPAVVSQSLQRTHKKWVQGQWNSPEIVNFVDRIYKMCEDQYDEGGEYVVECFTPREIIERFRTQSQVREYCKLAREQALNARFGDENEHWLAKMDREMAEAKNDKHDP